MDQELKQRLIGAAVVTALAAIFIPMLFDDPIDESGQTVSELSVPSPPKAETGDPAIKLPASASDVVSGTSTDDSATSVEGLENQDAELPLQPSEKIEPDEAFIEETGQPTDEQRWIEESTDAEESPRAADASGDGTAEFQPPADDEGMDAALNPEKELNAEAEPSAAEVTEKEPEAIKTEPSAASPAQSPPKKASASLPVAETAKRPKTEASNSKARLVRWYLQAGSFGKKENALSRQEALRKQGLPVFMETQTTAKGALYRLKIGPELDKKRAIAIRDRLSKQNVKTIILAE